MLDPNVTYRRSHYRQLVDPQSQRMFALGGSEVSFPIDLAKIGQEIDWGVSSSFTVMEEAKIVTFGQLIPKPGSWLHITRPGFRGRGVGRKLMVHLVNAGYDQHAIVISLVFHSDNESAVHRYQSLEFRLLRDLPRSHVQSLLIWNTP